MSHMVSFALIISTHTAPVLLILLGFYVFGTLTQLRCNKSTQLETCSVWAFLMLVVCLFLVQQVFLFWSGCLYILLVSGYKPGLFSLKGPSCIVFTLIRLWNFWSEISTMLVSVYDINGKIRMWTASSVWTYCGFDPCNYGSDQSTLLVDILCACSCNFAVLWKCWLLFYEWQMHE